MQDAKNLSWKFTGRFKNTEIEEIKQELDVIAESKVLLIKLQVFANNSHPLRVIYLEKFLVIFYILKWLGGIGTVILLPVFLYNLVLYLNGLDQRGISLEIISNLASPYFMLAFCTLTIGFLASRFAKFQLEMENNRKIAKNLVEEIRKNLEKIEEIN